MPRRVISLSWYRRHRLTIGYTLLCLAVAVLFLGNRSNTADIRRQARNGALAHQALCAQRDNLREAVRRGEQFLNLTPEQRVRRYGQLLGSVPASTVRAQLVGQRRALQAYQRLGC